MSCCQHEYYIYNGHEISSKSVDMLHEILRVLPHCHWRPCLILDANDSRLLWRRHVGRKVGWSRNTCGSFLLQHCPVECVVILVVQSAEQDPEARIRDCKNLKWEPEKLAQVHVVRRLLKAQAAAVVEIHCKLCWESLAQHLQARFKMWNKIYIYMPIDNLNQRLRWCQISEFTPNFWVFWVSMAEFDRNSESFFLGHFGSFLAHFRSFGAI